jgi:type IV secretory pathway VirB2 component (pilin)
MSNTTKRSSALVLAFLPARLSGAPVALASRFLAAVRKLDARHVATVAVAGAMLLAADPAFAQAGGSGDITTFLQNLVNIITGTAGKLIAVLAIAITGILWMAGAASARAAGSVVFGVMLVFSASWIVNQIIGA